MSPADVPQGLQSTTNLTGGFAVSLPTAFQSSKDVYKHLLKTGNKSLARTLFLNAQAKIYFN